MLNPQSKDTMVSVNVCRAMRQMLLKPGLRIAFLLLLNAILANFGPLLAQEPVHIFNGERVNKEFMHALARGNKLQAQNKHAGALIEYKKALQLAPANSEALSYCATTLSTMGRNLEAFEYYDQLSKKEPTNKFALLDCADVLSKAGRTRAAIRYYERAVELNPKDSQTLYRLGNSFMQLHQPKLALRYFEKSVAVDPHNLRAQIQFGEVLLQLQRRKEAIACFEKIRESTEYFDEMAWFLESGTYASLGQNEKAASICDEFIRKFPDCRKACLEMQDRAKILRMHGIEKTALDKAVINNSYLYEIEIHRWNSAAPIKVHVRNGKQVKYWNERYNQAVRGAFTAWQNKSSSLLRFNFVNSPEAAQIICTWTDNIPGGVAGRTSLECTNNKEIKSASIVLATTPNNKVKLSSYNVESAALHEVGHALGITGHSSLDSDVMFYNYDLSPNSSAITFRENRSMPSNRDIATIWQIYSWTPNNRGKK